MSETRTAPDLILFNGRFHTLDPANPVASAVVIDCDVHALAHKATKLIGLQGRSALPGLIDNHLHLIRGGLNFNMELRWDGVRSLADAMSMLKRQVAVTP